MLNIARRVAVGGGLWVLALPGLAQQGAPPPLKPGPEHEVLKQDLGTWDATVETMEPGKPPAVSKGVETVSLLEGGLWTITDFKGTMMGAPFHGHGTNGFDLVKKKYVSTWVDSMSAGIYLVEAAYDPKTKTLKGRMEGPDDHGVERPRHTGLHHVHARAGRQGRPRHADLVQTAKVGQAQRTSQRRGSVKQALLGQARSRMTCDNGLERGPPQQRTLDGAFNTALESVRVMIRD